MKELIKYLEKENQKRYLEIFLIIDQISKTEDIISFTYDRNFLIVQTGVNDYYRINMKEVKKC